MSNIFDFPPQPKKVRGLEISESVLTIGGDDYRVRRAAEPETQRGFVTVSDADGKAVLVFSASFPAEHIGQLLVGWRAGFQQGRANGRQEGISIVPGAAS